MGCPSELRALLHEHSQTEKTERNGDVTTKEPRRQTSAKERMRRFHTMRPAALHFRQQDSLYYS